jgi:hypothetical protein
MEKLKLLILINQEIGPGLLAWGPAARHLRCPARRISAPSLHGARPWRPAAGTNRWTASGVLWSAGDLAGGPT